MDIVFLIVTSVFLLVAIIGNRTRRNKRLNEQLDKEIQDKILELGELKKRSIDKSTEFSVFQMDALDIYASSNIRLPADILEELYYSDIYDFEEIIRFIENQRIQWKLENSKKVFLKKVK